MAVAVFYFQKHTIRSSPDVSVRLGPFSRTLKAFIGLFVCAYRRGTLSTSANWKPIDFTIGTWGSGERKMSEHFNKQCNKKGDKWLIKQRKNGLNGIFGDKPENEGY